MRPKKIKWLDHVSDPSWLSPEDIAKWAKKRDSYNVTIGYVTYEDDRVIVVSSEMDGFGNFGNHTKIYKLK